MGSLQSPIGGIWAVHLGPLGEDDNAGLGLECSFVSEDVFFSLRKTMLLKSTGFGKLINRLFTNWHNANSGFISSFSVFIHTFIQHTY